MAEFKSWRERLVVACGKLPDRILYTRKSTAGEDRQVASHEQQMQEVAGEFGPVNPTWWWKDSCTGTTFDRPNFQDILDFCRTNPRPIGDPGRFEIYDPARFGRTLTQDGRPDIFGFLGVYNQFEQTGGELHFVTAPRTGSDIADVVTLALYAYSAAIYSANLSTAVTRGMRGAAAQGWWTGGPAPWGTKRFDTLTGRVLPMGQASTPGGGGTILVPDEMILKFWHESAKRLLAGVSLDAIGDGLYEQGMRGPRGGALGHRSIKNFLSNPALVGVLERRGKDENNQPATLKVRAKWGPMVDPLVFRQVENEIEERGSTPRNRQRRKREFFPLRPICASCGGGYTGGRHGTDQGGGRTYVHTKPKKRQAPDASLRFQACGCKTWNVDAADLEDQIKDLIARERSSPEFEAEVRELILERDEFRAGAENAVEQARLVVRELENQETRLAETLLELTKSEDYDASKFLGPVRAVQQRLSTALRELDDAEQFAQSREDAWHELAGIIHETRNLADAWPNLTPEERKTLLDYWVHDVLIVVEPIAGMKRANTKTAIVTLRTDPHAPKYFTIGGQSSSVRPISSSTNGSDSSANREESASSPAGESTRPSAQAACPRTMGVASESADTSVGTASSDPQLPNATHTLRSNPERPALSTGEPANERRNPRPDNDKSRSANSISGGPSSSDREAYPGSEDGTENLQVYGHTSWQISHPKTRFPIKGRSSRGIGPFSSMVR